MQGPAGEKFSLFVGSIVDGLENGWLESILGVRLPTFLRLDLLRRMLTIRARAGCRSRTLVPPSLPSLRFRRVRRGRVGPAVLGGRQWRGYQDAERGGEDAAGQGGREDAGQA